MAAPVRHEHINHRQERVRILGWPVEGAKLVVLAHHGLGSHIGRWQAYADALEGLPVTLWGYDCRGHGQSGGKRGHAEGVTELADDYARMVPVLLEHAGVERALGWGHSMGAAALLWYLTHHPIHAAFVGIGLSAAPVVPELSTSQKVKVFMGRHLARVAPSRTLSTELPLDGISSYAPAREAYLADPLVHDRISLQLAASLIDEAPSALELASRIALPTLLFHGVEDPIAAIAGSRALAAEISSSTLHEFAGLRHEVHHEVPERHDEVFDVIRGFVASRID
jgi:alpha-beta hydrolase superfamily lysophospholipase